MNIAEFNRCANCGACVNICPCDAITVEADGLFYAPKVDTSVCVDCSRCVQVCPVNQVFEGKKPMSAFAGWHKEKQIVLASSSGGVFYGLAQSVISKGGVVFSAVYSDDCKTIRFASSDDVPLESMMKSKYVESLVGLSFRRIRGALEAGRKVLFCGTPCQCAGLDRFLGREYDSLLICDFVCGGLPSHKIYQAYLNDLEDKYSSAVQSVDFRPKTYGWKRYALRIRFANGKERIRLGTEDPYLSSFLHGKYTVRDYCLDCKFPVCHASDLTIADFWLHEKLSDLRQKNGISLILCNTTKGKRALDSICGQYELTELDVEAASYNNHVQVSEKRKQNHDAFLECYHHNGLEAAFKTFSPATIQSKTKDWIVRTLSRKRRSSS